MILFSSPCPDLWFQDDIEPPKARLQQRCSWKSTDCYNRSGSGLYKLWLFAHPWNCMKMTSLLSSPFSNFQEELKNRLSVNVQLSLHHSDRHLLISDQMFISFWNCFRLSSTWRPPSPCVIFKVLTSLSEPFEDKGTRWSFISINCFKYFVCFSGCPPDFETKLDIHSLLHDNKENTLCTGLLRMNWMS